MKRFITLLLVMVMVLSLCACGGKSKPVEYYNTVHYWTYGDQKQTIPVSDGIEVKTDGETLTFCWFGGETTSKWRGISERLEWESFLPNTMMNEDDYVYQYAYIEPVNERAIMITFVYDYQGLEVKDVYGFEASIKN